MWSWGGKAKVFRALVLLTLVSSSSGQAGVVCRAKWALVTATAFVLAGHNPSLLSPVPPPAPIVKPKAAADEIRFTLLTAGGEIPSVRLFHDSFAKRQLAQRINRAAYNEESDSRIRKLINPDQQSLTISFEGLTLRPRHDRDDRFEVVIIGQTRQFVFPQLIPRAKLESGEPIHVAGTLRKSRAFATGEAETTMDFRYDRARKSLFVEEVSGSMKVKMGWTFEGSHSFSGLTGTVTQAPFLSRTEERLVKTP